MDSWNIFCLLGRENKARVLPAHTLCSVYSDSQERGVNLWPNTKKYDKPIYLTTTFWWFHCDSQGCQHKSSSLENPFRACVTGDAHPLWLSAELKLVCLLFKCHGLLVLNTPPLLLLNVPRALWRRHCHHVPCKAEESKHRKMLIW